MRKTYLYIMSLLAATTLFATTSCSVSDDDESSNPVTVCPVDATSRAVFESSKKMGYPFFHETCKISKPMENIMVSPLSLTEVLAMLANGAAGDTQKQILAAMDMGDVTSKQASLSLQTLNDFLPKADKKTSVSLANSLWIDEKLNVNPDFVKYNKDILDAEVFNQKLNTTSTMNDINSWCKRKTNGCIDNILKEPLSAETKIAIMNALYFKGQWADKFDKSDTKDAEFTNADGSKSMVKMMHQTGGFLYWREGNMSVAEFPYGNGSYCMDVILPDEGVSLDECMVSMSKEKMDEMFKKMYGVSLDVFMPRMELKCTKPLVETLKSMGMISAFNPAIADFSGMSSDRLYVSQVKQATFLKVDEEGTEAAAVTIADMNCTSAGPSTRIIEFNMNRPFAFLIREKQTGVVLFIGRMVSFK